MSVWFSGTFMLLGTGWIYWSFKKNTGFLSHNHDLDVNENVSYKLETGNYDNFDMT